MLSIILEALSPTQNVDRNCHQVVESRSTDMIGNSFAKDTQSPQTTHGRKNHNLQEFNSAVSALLIYNKSFRWHGDFPHPSDFLLQYADLSGQYTLNLVYAPLPSRESMSKPKFSLAKSIPKSMPLSSTD